LTTDARSYGKHLEDQILSTLGTKSTIFSEIVENAGGAFPVDVRDALLRLVHRGCVRRRGRIYRLAAKFRFTFSGPPVGSDFYPPVHLPFRALHSRAIRSSLPAPHPADYDWRFTPRALSNLVHLFLHVRNRSCRVALLGAPSLFLELLRGKSQAVLFDRNPIVISYLRRAGFTGKAIQQDMFAALPRRVGTFGAVLADPPWYLDFYKAFILRASELLRTDGIFLLSMLPWLTRPNATDDRTEILRFANEAGFHLFGVLPNFLEYETPHFEEVVLQHHGIRCDNWRKADLFIWVKIRRASPSAFRIAKSEHDEWQDFVLDGKIIKLRIRKQSPATTFSYKPVANDSPVLRTVSRRWPHRASIDVWTSDNEAYTVRGLEALRVVLRTLRSGKSARQAISIAAAQLHIDPVGARSLAQFLRIICGQ
jgi:hypothetical protein